MPRGPGYTQPPGWKATVLRILSRDGHTCYACGSEAITADHVIPQSQGGSHDDGNLAAICASCHEVKSEAERRAGYAQHKALTKLPREPHPGSLALGGVPLPVPLRMRGV